MRSVLNLEEGSVLWNEAKKLYNRGPRAYHTFDHATEVLKRVGWVEHAVGFVDPDAARLAALYHDAVYVIGSADNESKSADEMWRVVYDSIPEGEPITKELNDCVDKAAALINATAHHTTHLGFFTDWDSMLFLDCDMLGFASDWDEFQSNNRNIDKEFSMSVSFNAEKYAEGRIAFLNALYRKGIFRSPYIRKLYEKQAKDNLRRYLTELGSTEAFPLSP